MPPTWPELGDLVARVRAAPPRLGSVRLVAIDGPAGSGKSTLAAALAEALDRPPDAGPEIGPVSGVHLDDLYEGWTGLEGVWDRLSRWVLEPLAEGRAGRYRRYDWVAGAWAEWVDLPVPAVLLVEGCGAAPRAVDGLAVLRVWVEAAPAVRLARGLARDGEALRDHWSDWMAAEAAHFAAERTRERADVHVVTADPVR